MPFLRKKHMNLRVWPWPCKIKTTIDMQLTLTNYTIFVMLYHIEWKSLSCISDHKSKYLRSLWTVIYIGNITIKGTNHNPPNLRELLIRTENTQGLLMMQFTEINLRYFEAIGFIVHWLYFHSLYIATSTAYIQTLI